MRKQLLQLCDLGAQRRQLVGDLGGTGITGGWRFAGCDAGERACRPAERGFDAPHDGLAGNAAGAVLEFAPRGAGHSGERGYAVLRHAQRDAAFADRGADRVGSLVPHSSTLTLTPLHVNCSSLSMPAAGVTPPRSLFAAGFKQDGLSTASAKCSGKCARHAEPTPPLIGASPVLLHT